jgi:hypothetical protein
MRRHGPLHVLKVVVMVVVGVTLISFATMHLWNWLMPAVFGLRTISWVQSLGLLVLSKILFGGFGRGGRGGRRGWKRDMKERWEQMSPEERERLRAGMRGRWGYGFGPEREDVNSEKPMV